MFMVYFGDILDIIKVFASLFWSQVAPARLVAAGRCVCLSWFVPHAGRGFVPGGQPLPLYAVVADGLPITPFQGNKKRIICLVNSKSDNP